MPCVVQSSHAIEWYFGKAANHLNAVNIRGKKVPLKERSTVLKLNVLLLNVSS